MVDFNHFGFFNKTAFVYPVFFCKLVMGKCYFNNLDLSRIKIPLNPKIMKKHLSKKALWQSLLSVITIGIFLLLALGSIELQNYIDWETQDMGDGVKKETLKPTGMVERSCTGSKDSEGRWQGVVTIEWGGDQTYTEEVFMSHGERSGKSVRTYPDGTKEEDYYVDGVKLAKDEKAAHGITEDISAFQVLGNKYPWFLFSMNAFGFDNVYVEAYMDTVETMLGTFEFEPAEFDNYYGDVVDELGATPYDSIIGLNSILTLVKGLEEMKNSELRLAIFNRYRSAGNTTYNIVNTTYPGYMQALSDSGVSNQDFERFCHVLDSCMISYGDLDLEDPFFADSVDSRMFRALSFILDNEVSSASATGLSVKIKALSYEKVDLRGFYHEFKSLHNSFLLKSTPSEVAALVVSLMLQQYVHAEMFRQAFMEAFFMNKGVIHLPTAATLFSGNNSATSVTLQGYVIEDGGAAVTSRGIAWAAFYNPTVNDNPVTSGTGTGDFSVTLNGLTEGVKYYARTYATNSAGTAYGNCIDFIAATPTGIHDTRIFKQDLGIYPNPASAVTTLSFHLGSSESILLTVTDMKGQLVIQKYLGNLPQGENQIKLNFSGLQNGMYTCQLSNGTAKVMRKLVIAH
jgi:hypothetical protein